MLLNYKKARHINGYDGKLSDKGYELLAERKIGCRH